MFRGSSNTMKGLQVHGATWNLIQAEKGLNLNWITGDLELLGPGTIVYPGGTVSAIPGFYKQEKGVLLYRPSSSQNWQVYNTPLSCQLCQKGNAKKMCGHCNTPYCSQLCASKDWKAHQCKNC